MPFRFTVVPREATSSERQELVDAAIARYREGTTGPVSFVAEVRRLGVSAIEAEQLKRAFRDECARRRRCMLFEPPARRIA
jgi:hypothetical protein